MTPRVFLITGTSTGFGAELVRVVIDNGDYVVATARKSSSLSFHGMTDENSLLVDLDVTDTGSINKAFDAAIKKFKRVDVVVNNAGYGLSGEFESLSDKQIRAQVEVNFFGLINVTRKALEVMRDLKTGGRIQQVTSVGGQIGVPTYSIYCASKWAVEGFSEATQKELRPEWGIQITCIEPGGFRTDWAGRSMQFGDNHPAYDHIDARANAKRRHGTQPGDPAKAAKAFYQLAVMKDPPMRCAIGTDAYAAMKNKLKEYDESVKKYEQLSNGTDVDGYRPPN